MFASLRDMGSSYIFLVIFFVHVHYLETGSTSPCYNVALNQLVLERRNEGVQEYVNSI